MKNNKLTILRILFSTLLICNFIIIFLFSNQNGEDSTSISQGFIYNIIKLFIKDPIKINETIILIEPAIRKIAHFTIYALAGVWMICLLNTYNIKTKNKLIIGILIGFLYAVSDEIHQSFIGERNCSPIDVLIDTTGFAFGMMLIIWANKIIKKKRNVTKILQQY